MFNEPDPIQMAARNGRLQGMLRLDPFGEASVGWLYSHDPVAAAAEAHPAPPVAERRMARSDSQRAADLWRGALTLEDRAGLWRGEREGYERFLQAAFGPPPDLAIEDLDCDGVPSVRVTPPGTGTGIVVLHLHGGGFTMGSARGSAELAGRLARAVGGWALAPGYRLAPEHAFPAALDDALTAYRWLRREHPDARIVVSGEGAGGGLTVSLAIAAREADDPLPDLLHAVSPFCDLTVTAASVQDPAGPDPWHDQARLRILAASYLHGTDPATPLASPVHADLRGLPPLLVQAAAGEALADDARRLHDAALRAGVDVALELVEDTVHSFVLFDFLPESHTALERMAEY
jgi:salicylate hydroxylase